MRPRTILLAFLSALFLRDAAYAHAPFPGLPVHHASFVFTKGLVSHVAPHAHFFFPPSHSTSTRFDFGKSLSQLLAKHALVDPPRRGFGPGNPFAFLNQPILLPYKPIATVAIVQGIGSVPPFQPAPPFNGGIVKGGALQGTLYVVNEFSAIPDYVNLGGFTAPVGVHTPATIVTPNHNLVGTNVPSPNFQNTLFFKPSGIIPPHINFGDKFAGPGLFSGLWRNSFTYGQELGIIFQRHRIPTLSTGGNVSGGIFFGTAYRNSLGNPAFISSTFVSIPGFGTPSPLYVFAFGNNPLNNPAAKGSFITIPTGSSTVQFASGLNETVSSGQILYPMINVDPAFRNGSVLTMGANAANNGILNQTLTNLTSFLFF